MKLLPAMIVILLIFLVCLLFLELRGLHRSPAFSHFFDPLKKKKLLTLLFLVALLLLTGALFKLMGKIAILIGLLAGVTLFLILRKA